MAKNLAERLALALEPWKARLGRITLIAGIGMVLLGFPAQIYAVRIPYQVSARAWYLLPADVLGLLASIVLVYQYISY